MEAKNPKPIAAILLRQFRGAPERVRVLRLVCASNDSGSRTALVRLRLENLDSRIFGEEFPENAIRVRANADHFDLMSAEHVLRQGDELVVEQQAVIAKQETTESVV
jgi:hypothetical protein